MLALAATLGLFSSTMAAEYVPGESLRAGFINVDPLHDYGWTHAHEQARRICEETFPWLETVFVEDVSEEEVAHCLDHLIQNEGCHVAFATSFSFIDQTVAAAKRYPDNLFGHYGHRTGPGWTSNAMTYLPIGV